ncbi:MAG: Ldh family oxidoreductase [Candidatus Latescibacteria bacterium]|nr:Ldh family oxidoreductase [Candidatus Latescibacterota bacterium]
MPRIAVDELRRTCSRIFTGAGLQQGEADQIAWSLVQANLMGHDSHGVIRIVQYIKALQGGRVQPGKALKIIRQADASAVVDGGWGFGQTVCHQAMQLAVEKARARSVGVVELFNSSHIGRLGEYVEWAAEQGFIGICMCNNHGGGQLQPAFGGIDAKMSPNPLAVGIPTGKGFPIVVDMTSSVVAEGKIRVKRNQGEALPDGWIIDAEGKPSNDPDKFYGPPHGAILPFGGVAAHKGYALAVVVDVLSGALGGSGCSGRSSQGGGNGVFIMALDIGAFTGPELFEEEIDHFIDHLKASRLLPGFDGISLPGEIEQRLRLQRQADGVDVDEETWRQIGATAEAVGVALAE